MCNVIFYVCDMLKIVKFGDVVVGVYCFLGEVILKVVVCLEGNVF